MQLFQIVDGILTLTYNMGNGIRNLELSRRFVSNGQWHTAQVERNGREFVLKMDNMEGANYNFTYGFPDDKQELHMHNMMFAGAIVSFSNSLPVLASDLEDSKSFFITTVWNLADNLKEPCHA